MSKLDEVLKALNKMLGKNAVQTAANLIKSAEMILEEDSQKGEKIPSRSGTVPKPQPAAAPKPKISFFENDTSHAGSYTPPKPQSVTGKHYEPINQRRQEMPSYHKQYHMLRDLGLSYAQSSYYGAPSTGERFYKQAQLIATFNDDYNKNEAYTGFYYSFMDLSIRQFRRYVTLRRQFLAEDYSAVDERSVGYLHLFACEIISSATYPALDPEQVCRKLALIADRVRTVEEARTGNTVSYQLPVESWTFLYAVAHGQVEWALAYENTHYGRNRHASSLEAAANAYYQQDETALLAALSLGCPYHICTTAVCKKEPFDRIYPKLFWAVLQALDGHFHSAKTMEERLFGRKFQKTYTAFSETEARMMDVSSFTAALSPARSFGYDDKTKKFSVISHLQLNSDWIAAVLRCMDYFFRFEVDAVKLKSSGMSSAAQEKVIAAAVHSFCVSHNLVGFETRRKQAQKSKKKQAANKDPDRIETPAKVEIDLSKLAEIRKDASEVETRLLSVYEEQAAELDILPVNEVSICEEKPQITEFIPEQDEKITAAAQDEWVDFAGSLSDVQRDFLKLLLTEPQAAKAYLQNLQVKTGMMPQLVIEGINELSLEYIGDTVFDGDGTDGVYEDYIEAASAVLL